MQIDSLAGQGSYATPTNTKGSERIDSGKRNETIPLPELASRANANGLTQSGVIEDMQKEHEIIQAIERANKHIRIYDRKLEFTIHDSTKQIMVKVINTEDDTVIREIPSEKVLDMVAHMWEVAGILVDEKR